MAEKSLMELAKSGKANEDIKRVAEEEKHTVDYVLEKVASGRIVILKNKRRKVKIKPVGIGEGLRTKVNTNIGTSSDHVDLDEELKKLEVAVRAGTDTVMDLSTGGDIDYIRKKIIEHSPVPVGTVPIYQAAIEAAGRYGTIVKMTKEQIFEVIEKHLEDGVDFITVHVGVTRHILEVLRKHPRIMNSVSRGGTFLLTWMFYNRKENPLYEYYDELLKLARKYEATLSLGDGMRPGCIADASDPAQLEELFNLGELARRAREEGVQVMIEGPGHVPIDQIVMNMQLEKRITGGAPFYVLGPLPTDVAMGWDHIAMAAGGALAAANGADFLCYLTPAEHIRLPKPEDVYEGVIATRIAAHIGDLAKGIPGAWQWDLEMSRARARRDWNTQIKLSMDPERVSSMRGEIPPEWEDTCSMCGKFCALKLLESFLSGNKDGEEKR